MPRVLPVTTMIFNFFYLHNNQVWPNLSKSIRQTPNISKGASGQPLAGSALRDVWRLADTFAKVRPNLIIVKVKKIENHRGYREYARHRLWVGDRIPEARQRRDDQRT